MNVINKTMYTWHLFQYRSYENLVNDCLSHTLRSKLMIKATYHRELAKHYSDTVFQTIE